MNPAKSWLLFLFLVAFSAEGADTEMLEARHEASISTPQGKKYQTKAVQAFWRDACFMRECAPPNTPIAEPLTIYFEVKPDGSMGTLVIHPRSRVADCIAANAKDRRFPPPPKDYVGKIYLKFTE